MISIDNQPTQTATSDEDFTEHHYRQLLKTAKMAYRFATYDDIPWESRFVLWRHDLDYSINRAAALARIEAEEGVKATYFVNPCSEFYNPFEPAQARLIKEIVGLGHHLGLHFDAGFHNVQSEEELHEKIACEGRWLKEAFNFAPKAFSFHNPAAAHLQCSNERYGGLLNCYSSRLKNEVAYCSDSNGYWRFRRLHDVLTNAEDHCLQVLTHPGWWQEKAMPPQQRIFRSAYGRAKATMRAYDAALSTHGRLNHTGPAAALDFLRQQDLPQYEHCSQLWNESRFSALFISLWGIYERRIAELCETTFRQTWQVSEAEIAYFFAVDWFHIDAHQLFVAVFDELSWPLEADRTFSKHLHWLSMRDTLVRGDCLATSSSEVEQGCVYLCSLIQGLTEKFTRIDTNLLSRQPQSMTTNLQNNGTRWAHLLTSIRGVNSPIAQT